MTKSIILIPARYQSSRFPGKPLALICGKTMIQHVYDNCFSSGIETAVVTDNTLIENEVKKFNGRVIRVDDDVSSGTERIQLAISRYFPSFKKDDIVINVQGDEPLLSGKSIQQLVTFHTKSDFDITTMVRQRMSDENEFKNPNIVKVIYEQKNGECHYFSRASIPFGRDVEKWEWFQHIGVYSYRLHALNSFCQEGPRHGEKLEKLEQLRALDLGQKIGAIRINDQLIGVDTPEDIQNVEKALNNGR